MDPTLETGDKLLLHRNKGIGFHTGKDIAKSKHTLNNYIFYFAYVVYSGS